MEYIPPEKESTENDAAGGSEVVIVEEEEPDASSPTIASSPVTSSPIIASSPVTSTSSSPASSPSIDAQLVYENSFAVPETSQAASTYTLFSDPLFFTPDSIRNRTHYLHGSIRGTLWLDRNNDGVRGSASNRTLNAMEFDYGIGGVRTHLVRCEDDVLVKSTRSGVGTTAGDIDDGVVVASRRTDVPGAGDYTFPIEDDDDAGRYYVMYEAPSGYRMGGNVLPLGRRYVEGGDYYECVPRGGEGLGYVDEVYLVGDLDWEGYCARSIGCIEIDKLFKFRDDFDKLEFVDGTKEEDYSGTMKLAVAYPTLSALDVGLAVEEWPLGTDQYADSELTLSFPEGTTMEDLESIVPEDFDASDLKGMMEKKLLEYFKENGMGGGFDLRGVDLHSGKISSNKGATTTRSLRSFSLRDRSLDEGGRGATVTYSYTTRGKYNPPPSEQLGEILSESINDDSVGVVKSLGERGGEGNNDDSETLLPPVFAESEGAVSRHLSLKKPIVLVSDSNSTVASWATVPIVLLTASIASLIGVLLFRRLLGRRAKTAPNDCDPNSNPFLAYLEKGSGYAVTKDSKYPPLRDKKDKIKNATGSVNSSNASLSVSQGRAKGKSKNDVANSLISNGTSSSGQRGRAKGKSKSDVANSLTSNGTSSTGSANTAAKRGDVERRHMQSAWEAQIANQGQMIQPVRTRRTQ
jgi:hypothetical protein